MNEWIWTMSHDILLFRTPTDCLPNMTPSSTVQASIPWSFCHLLSVICNFKITSYSFLFCCSYFSITVILWISVVFHRLIHKFVLFRTATSIQYIGLTLTYASSFQMLRGLYIFLLGFNFISHVGTNLNVSTIWLQVPSSSLPDSCQWLFLGVVWPGKSHISYWMSDKTYNIQVAIQNWIIWWYHYYKKAHCFQQV